MKERSPAALGAALVTGVLLVLGSGCGDRDGDPQAFDGVEDTLAAVEGLSGRARTEKLLELAKAQGGELSLYTSMAGGDDAEIADAFEEAFDLDVSVYRASSPIVLQRVLEESDAGFRGADAVESDSLILTVLAARDLLTPYASPAGGGLVEGAEEEGWTVTRFNTFVVSWNPELVPPGRRPRRWEDLADPAWRGKIALDPTDIDWYMALRQYWIDTEGKSEQEADRLFEGIARNAVIIQGHTLMAQLLSAGEFPIVGANFRHIVERFTEDDAPVAWEPPVEPLISRSEGVGVLRSARHPAAALLFADWLLAEGQEVIVELGRDAARRDLATAPQAEQIMVDASALVADEEEWRDRFERLLRGATQGEQSD